MKRNIFVTAILLCLACIGCGNDNAKEITLESGANAQPYPGTVKFTHEENAENARQMVKNIHDSYDKMLKAAKSEDATKEGKKAVEEASASIKEQIDSLDKIDWDAMSDDEIADYSEKLADLITQIREIRDLLEGI